MKQYRINAFILNTEDAGKQAGVFLSRKFFSLIAFLFAVILLFPDAACASDSLKVDSIIVRGNNKTKTDIILRELTFSSGDTVTSEMMSFNKERVFSLGLFTSVRFRGMRSKGLNIVMIDVEESWYIWPLPFIYIRDNTIKRSTYGVNILYKNFRGRNETLSTSVGLGYDPYFTFTYYNPWLIRQENIYLSSSIGYQNLLNKSPEAEKLYGKEFKQRFFTYILNVGKRIDLFNEAGVFAGFDYVHNPDDDKFISFSGDRINRVPKAGATYTYDSRNLKQFPDSGMYANIYYSYNGFNIKRESFSVIKADFRHYFYIWNDFSFKWRLTSRFINGWNIPFYENSMLGVLEKVRGHYNERREGDIYYLASAELKYPLIKDWNYKLKLPLIPREITRYRIKVFLNIFGDTGTTQFKDEKLSIKGFYSGYGAGITLLFLPYNTLRFEVAFDQFNKSELIFGTGYSF